MTAREIITDAIWYEGDDPTVLKQFRINLNRIADIVSTSTLVEDWQTASDKVNSKLGQII